MTDYKSMPFEEFEHQWYGMLQKFANWKFGMDQDDLKQELRVVMWKCQHSWDPAKGVKMSTYLWNALWNKTNKLRVSLNFTQSRVPTTAMLPLDDDFSKLPSPDSMPEELDLLKGVGEEGRELARLALMGYDKPVAWREQGLTDAQIKTGKAQLERALEVASA